MEQGEETSYPAESEVPPSTEATFIGGEPAPSNITDNPLAPSSRKSTHPLTTDNDADLRVGGADSPDTLINDYTCPKPDITLYCSHCERHVSLPGLIDHRNYHRALATMSYKGTQRPDSVDELLTRRKKVLHDLQKQMGDSDAQPLDPEGLQIINEAFELLKSDMEDTYEAYRQYRDNVVTEVSGVALDCSADCVTAVGFCSSGNQRWKSYMEDTRVFQDCFGNDRHKCFFGLYDGHNGFQAAELAAQELHHALLIEMSKFDPTTKCTCSFNMADDLDARRLELHSRASSTYTEKPLIYEESTWLIHRMIADCGDKLKQYTSSEGSSSPKSTRREQTGKLKKTKDPFTAKMHNALKKAHYYTDMLLSLGKDEHSKIRWSGTSTLACMIKDAKSTDESTNNIGENTDATDNNNKETKENEEMEKVKEPPTVLGRLFVANAGNSQAVLVRDNKAYKITKTHTLYNPKEKDRVIKTGGTISGSSRELRVNGILSTTRGLGNHGDPLLKKCVINDPQVMDVAIDQYAQFIVLATNGVWEVFSEYEAASILVQLLPSNMVPAPSIISSGVDRLLVDNVTPLSFNDAATIQSSPDMTLETESVTQGPHDQPKDQPKPTSALKGGRHRPNTSKSSVSFADGQSAKISQRNDEIEDQYFDQDSDLKTEIGSRSGNIDDSGDEADIDTMQYSPDEFVHRSGILCATPSSEDPKLLYSRVMSERLVQAALLAGARDNITVMVMLLPGCGL